MTFHLGLLFDYCCTLKMQLYIPAANAFSNEVVLSFIPIKFPKCIFNQKK